MGCRALTSLLTFLWPLKALLSWPQSDSGQCFSWKSQEHGSKCILLGWDNSRFSTSYCWERPKPQNSHFALDKQFRLLCNYSWEALLLSPAKTIQESSQNVQNPGGDQPVVAWVAFCIPDGLRQKAMHTSNWLCKEGLARDAQEHS